MKGKYAATKIGALFTVLNLLAVITVVVPIFIVMPVSIIFESIFLHLFEDSPYKVIGSLTLLSILALAIAVSVFYFRRVSKQSRSAEPFDITTFVVFLVVQMFIVHPLVFYFQTSSDWSRASDGQFIFGVFGSFPVSSLAFIGFGFVTDMIRNVGSPIEEINK